VAPFAICAKKERNQKSSGAAENKAREILTNAIPSTNWTMNKSPQTSADSPSLVEEIGTESTGHTGEKIHEAEQRGNEASAIFSEADGFESFVSGEIGWEIFVHE